MKIAQGEVRRSGRNPGNASGQIPASCRDAAKLAYTLSGAFAHKSRPPPCIKLTTPFAARAQILFSLTSFPESPTSQLGVRACKPPSQRARRKLICCLTKQVLRPHVHHAASDVPCR